MNNLLIQPVKLYEVKILSLLSLETFYEAFIWGNTEENIQSYMQYAFNEEQLLKELNNPSSEFYFARIGESVVGYLKINSDSAQTVPVDAHALEIERIYVLKDFRRMSIGQLLFDKALTRARELGNNTLWLGVWEKNEAAIKFYERNGLTSFSAHTFMVGDDEQTDIMMKVNLFEQ